MPALQNKRHELFAQEVAKGSSLVSAYEAAGYARNRDSAHKARRRPDITRRIDELVERREAIEGRATAKAMERAAMLRAEVLLELSHIGRANIADILDFSDGTARIDPSKLTKERAAAISELIVQEDDEGRQHLRMKFHPKEKALHLLGMHYGLFVQRTANLNLNIHTTNTGEEENY